MKKNPTECLHVLYWRDRGGPDDGPRYNDCVYASAAESRLYVPEYDLADTAEPERLVFCQLSELSPESTKNWIRLATESDRLPYQIDHGLMLLPVCPELPDEALRLMGIAYRDLETSSPAGRYRFAYLDSGAASLAIFRLNTYFYLLACSQLIREDRHNEHKGGWRTLRRVLCTGYAMFPHAHVLNAHLVGNASDEKTADIFRVSVWHLLHGQSTDVPRGEAGKNALRRIEIDARVLFCRELEEALAPDPVAVAAKVARVCREVPVNRASPWYDTFRTMQQVLDLAG